MTVNKKHLFKKLFPLVMGGALGYAYYFFIGCNNGCPVQSNPMLSTIYGIFLGAVFILPSKKTSNSQVLLPKNIWFN